ncbi:hypothetical protein TVAG_245970 [Trichomonas vaginalis G3]|uniref:Uncharacterized protein n=1 Tax=Trichomonas vaginalis (strain ATCC PRA-98 / G3) TaxID=412133 RepID=A2E4Q5_TRIV3|nr:vault protein inter-alpha-trypsin domain-containing protein [Trichomonas vaginalis G3]EAY12365.1 hypothetical protein TVAG_245970 [Trichomonas vaginalis G3]KAI5500783.1 vault protein inter-alpha-trypsin domain-containing protein [Trichomonas vaginalis G3]|eukprot:XP_001324588.1 hypothetical protein [Trichomonas vaginalis G3]
MLKSAISTSASNISISAPDLTLTWPSPLPPLFANCSQSFIVKASKTDNVLISGDMGDDSVEEIVNVMEIPDNFGVKQLFARLTIAGIENKLESEPNEEEKQRCIKLSIESGIICKFTSYIGVDLESHENINDDWNSTDYSDDDDCYCGGGKIQYFINHVDHCASCALDDEEIIPYECASCALDDEEIIPYECANCYSEGEMEYEESSKRREVEEAAEPARRRLMEEAARRNTSKSSDSTISENIQSQNVDGSWDDFPGVNKEIEKKYGKVVAATLAAIVYIMKNYGSEGKYSLIIMKAKNFLKSKFNDVDWDSIINKM